jgi:hypothetical protein
MNRVNAVTLIFILSPLIIPENWVFVTRYCYLPPCDEIVRLAKVSYPNDALLIGSVGVMVWLPNFSRVCYDSEGWGVTH